MSKILIVEDHPNIGAELLKFFQQEGFVAELSANLADAGRKLEESPDLVLLDWMLPDGQGIDFVKDIHRRLPRVPIIFLTARVELVDRIIGLEMGASDYITKPFEPRELLARVRARLREAPSAQPPSPQIEVGKLSIDKVKHRVMFAGAAIELVRKEFELLVLFAENPDKVFSREEILNKVWGYEVYPTTRTVDTHVMLLRQKIHQALIETVRAVGYRLKPI